MRSLTAADIGRAPLRPLPEGGARGGLSYFFGYAAAIILAIASPALADVDPLSGIDFVRITHPGNAPWAGDGTPDDRAISRGGVDHEYNIGRFEVTTSVRLAPLPQIGPHALRRGLPARLKPLAELGHIDAPVAGLAVVHPGLRPFQPPAKFTLGQARRFAGAPQHARHRGVGACVLSLGRHATQDRCRAT